MGDGNEHQVKGVWFVTARKFVLEHHGADALQALADAVDPSIRGVIEEPIASEWYAEEALQQTLAAANQVLAGGDRGRFLRFIEGCTEQGVTRFFSVLIQLSTPAYIMSKVPFMWERIRRGPGFVQVEERDDGSLLHYQRFPYFDDPLYRWLTVGSLRAVVRRCTDTEPDVEILHWQSDELEVLVRHD